MKKIEILRSKSSRFHFLYIRMPHFFYTSTLATADTFSAAKYPSKAGLIFLPCRTHINRVGYPFLNSLKFMDLEPLEQFT